MRALRITSTIAACSVALVMAACARPSDDRVPPAITGWTLRAEGRSYSASPLILPEATEVVIDAAASDSFDIRGVVSVMAGETSIPLGQPVIVDHDTTFTLVATDAAGNTSMPHYIQVLIGAEVEVEIPAEAELIEVAPSGDKGHAVTVRLTSDDDLSGLIPYEFTLWPMNEKGAQVGGVGHLASYVYDNGPTWDRSDAVWDGRSWTIRFFLEGDVPPRLEVGGRGEGLRIKDPAVRGL